MATIKEFWDFLTSSGLSPVDAPEGSYTFYVTLENLDLYDLTADEDIVFSLLNTTQTNGSSYVSYEVANLELDVTSKSKPNITLLSTQGEYAERLLTAWLNR